MKHTTVAIIALLLVAYIARYICSYRIYKRLEKRKLFTGAEGLLGQIVEAKTDIDPKGKVFVEGSWWNAITEGEPIAKGERARIIKVQKLTLVVEKEGTQSVSGIHP